MSIITVAALIIGILIAGAGVYYLMKEKKRSRIQKDLYGDCGHRRSDCGGKHYQNDSRIVNTGRIILPVIFIKFFRRRNPLLLRGGRSAI